MNQSGQSECRRDRASFLSSLLTSVIPFLHPPVHPPFYITLALSLFPQHLWPQRPLLPTLPLLLQNFLEL